MNSELQDLIEELADAREQYDREGRDMDQVEADNLANKIDSLEYQIEEMR